MRRKTLWGRLALIVVAVLVVASLLSGWVVRWLWMDALGYAGVFWTVLAVQAGLFGAAFALVFAYFWVNLHVLSRAVDAGRLAEQGAEQIESLSESLSGGQAAADIVRRLHGLRRAAWLVALAPALIAGFALAGSWEGWIRFAGGPAFGESDPIYGRDIGFYVFRLPFLHTVETLLTVTAAAGTLLVGLGYLYSGALGRTERGRLSAGRRAMVHIAANAGLFVLALAFGQYLARFDLLTDSSGAVHGAGYTDVVVRRWALWLAIGAGLALVAAFAWVAATRQRPSVAVFAVGGYVLILALGLVVVPALFQRFVVEPNELELERPYLRHNIAFTRQAYGLDTIDERAYNPAETLTLADLRANAETVNNIRLWDWRPLSQTFRQLQQIRAYYMFEDVDIGRYRLGDDYRQVMLSARELEQELPTRADTWVNRHLQFTHGYGLVMTPAAAVGDNGRPELIVRDVPPVSPETLPIERPEVYYGEQQAGYRIVSTGIDEFNYPRGDENVYTRYAGHGGVPLGSWWRRTLFAWEQFDVSILLSNYIDETSRIQFHRPVQERVRTIAPFLRLDNDPYLVVDRGRLYWIQDAYTTADTYPYSEPADAGLNYVRNSVKVVIDAYHGDVRFYVADPDDPVLEAYRAFFPELFRPLDAMPEGLQRHVRYPADLFRVQIGVYNTYHMTVPQVFYNREDVWTVPREKYAGEPIAMEPYYILMRLPGEERLEFLLMQPLTPVNRDNMIAWVAARADAPHYGELVAFRLPKERLIMGPIQVEAMIDQDTRISRQLSLWDQRGSRVTRGNLLVIPIDRAFLYVEPVYLRAEQTDVPQLQRVIVSNGETVAMQPTLEQALRVVFGEARPAAPAEAEAPAAVRQPQVVGRAREALSAAQQALEQGDWATFGRQMQRLRDVLEE
jgi:hypothetical protein